MSSDDPVSPRELFAALVEYEELEQLAAHAVRALRAPTVSHEEAVRCLITAFQEVQRHAQVDALDAIVEHLNGMRDHLAHGEDEEE